MTRPAKIVVMGAGNILMQDDGVGVQVVRTLSQHELLPKDVEVIDAGTAAADYLSTFGKIDRLIVVDAVRGGGEPGTIYRFTPKDIRDKPGGRMSLHQMSLLESLDLSRLMGCAPGEVVIVGIEPKSVAEGVELSPELRAKMPAIINAIVELVHF